MLDLFRKREDRFSLVAAHIGYHSHEKSAKAAQDVNNKHIVTSRKTKRTFFVDIELFCFDCGLTSR